MIIDYLAPLGVVFVLCMICAFGFPREKVETLVKAKKKDDLNKWHDGYPKHSGEYLTKCKVGGVDDLVYLIGDFYCLGKKPDDSCWSFEFCEGMKQDVEKNGITVVGWSNLY